MEEEQEKPYTIEDGLKELYEPYRSQALANTDKERLKLVRHGPYESLGSAFDWEESPQGREYWSKIYNNIEDYT